MDRAKMERDLHTRGFSCGHLTDPPGQVWRNYIHNVDEVLIVVEGEMELELQGQTFRPAIGEEVLIPAGVVHTVRNVGPTTARWIYGYRRVAS